MKIYSQVSTFYFNYNTVSDGTTVNLSTIFNTGLKEYIHSVTSSVEDLSK